MVNGLTSIFALYVLAGTLFGFGSNQAKIRSRSLKLPYDQLCLAFRVNSSKMKRRMVRCFWHPLDCSYTFSSADFLTFSKFGNPLGTRSQYLCFGVAQQLAQKISVVKFTTVDTVFSMCQNRMRK